MAAISYGSTRDSHAFPHLPLSGCTGQVYRGIYMLRTYQTPHAGLFSYIRLSVLRHITELPPQGLPWENGQKIQNFAAAIYHMVRDIQHIPYRIWGY